MGKRADIAFVVSTMSQFMSKAGRSTALDGRKMHHEIFEGRIGLQIMSWSQIYILRRFCYAEWT